MGAAIGKKKGGVSDINLTPLIDIVLVVLIIMMVNIPIKVDAMGVKLPPKLENVPPPPDTPPDQLVIALYEDGKVALNRRLMTEDVLLYKLSSIFRSEDARIASAAIAEGETEAPDLMKAKKQVFVDAHPKVPFGKVVDMVDLAREAGAEKVGFSRMKDTGPVTYNEAEPGSIPRGLHVGPAEVVGAMDTLAAQEAFKPYSGNAEKCFLDRLGAAPTMSGVVVPKVAVGPHGEVMSHTILTTSLGNPEVEACIDNLMGALKFKPLGGNRTAWVQYRLLFSPG